MKSAQLSQYVAQLLSFWAFLVVVSSTPTRDETSASSNKKAYTEARRELELRNLILQKDFASARRRLEEHPEEAHFLVEIKVQSRYVVRHMALHEALMVDIPERSLNDVDRSPNTMPRDQVDLIMALIEINPRVCIQKDLRKRNPLHLALATPVVPPPDVLKAIIDSYPMAVRSPDMEKRLPLHTAAATPMTSFHNIELVYDAYPDAIGVLDSDEALPIHLAAWGGNYEDSLSTIQFLHQKKPDSLGVKDKDGETVVSLMAKYGRSSSDALSYVLEKDSKALSRVYDERDNNSILHFAVSAATVRNKDIYRPILERYPRLAKKINAIGKTPLHTSLGQCCAPASMIYDLLDAFPQAASNRDGLGYLPLHYAVAGGVDSVEIVKKLLETAPETVRVKQIPPKQSNGPLPLHLALRHGAFEGKMHNVINDIIFHLLFMYHEAAKIVDPKGNGMTPLQSAVGSRRPPRIVKRMINLVPDAVPAKVNVQGGIESTAFHLFCSIGPSYLSPEEVKDVFVAFLLADPDASTRKDSLGRLGLHQVWDNVVDFDAQQQLFDLLVRNHYQGSSVLDNDNKSPLFYAAHARDAHAVRKLLAHFPEGARTKSKSGVYPLHELCERGPPRRDPFEEAEMEEMITLLLDAFPEAASLATEKELNLPLHLLARSVGYDHTPKAVVKMVIEAFPDAVSTPNKEGQLPIHSMVFPLTAEDVKATDAPYWVGFVEALLEANGTVAGVVDRQGKAALQKILHTMDSLSSLRRVEDDHVLQVVQLLFQEAPEVVLRRNSVQRNALHAIVRMIGDSGGMTTKGWSNFAIKLLDLYPSLAMDQDKAKRSPLHLFLLYLGDTAIGSRQNQQEATKALTPELEAVLTKLLETFPEGLEAKEEFDLTPVEIITHERLRVQKNKNSYENSLIIKKAKQLLERGPLYWRLAQRLNSVTNVGNNCADLQSRLDQLKRDIEAELKRKSASSRPIQGVTSCAFSTEEVCEMCPEQARMIDQLSFDLVGLGNAFDTASAVQSNEETSHDEL